MMRWWVLCGMLLLGVVALAGPVVTRMGAVSVDLTGDGTVERVALDATQEGAFTLRVRDCALRQTTPDEAYSATGFAVVDLDRKDRRREVAVRTAEASTETWYLFAYDGTLTLLGEVSETPEFPGDGGVLVTCWQGFWRSTDRYRLDPAAKRLAREPQPCYYVGAHGTAGTAQPLYREPKLGDPIAALQPNHSVLILLNQGEWYLLKTDTNLTGWLPAAVLTPQTFPDLPWAG